MCTPQLPTFLIIGAQKAGTSSLYQYLRQHPDVFMASPKEPEFFALEGQTVDHRAPKGCTPNENSSPYTDFAAYKSLFEGSSEYTAVGEASTLYLYSPQAPERIQQYVPEARLIAVLRNPVERAYSAYLMAKRSGNEPLSFEDALAKEEKRIDQDFGYLWRYRDFGRYYEQLKRYTRRFDADQLQIFLLEDLKEEPLGVVREIFRLIRVDPSFEPDLSLQHNKGGVPRSSLVSSVLGSQNALKSIIKLVLPAEVRERIRHMVRDANLHKPDLSAKTRQALTKEYEEEILDLQDLIGRDLSHWLAPLSSSSESDAFQAEAT